MTRQQTPPAQSPARFERTYDAPVEDLWDLWTTKEGFESWWGPEGFRVEVHALDLRVGGELNYDMIAVGEEQVAHMKAAGMPLSHGTSGTFVEIVPLRRLALRHVIDFIPGMATYTNDMVLELSAEAGGTRMVVTVQPHMTAEWTANATAGMASQLTKVPAVLAARRA